MAVSNTTSTINYSGTNTGNQTCPIPFLFLDNSDIVVTLLPATGASSVLVLGTQYSLAGAGNDAGGTATIFAPVPTTTTINISRNVPATQLTSFVTADRFPAKTIERAFDKATMLVQQFLRASNRTLRFGAASPEQPELAPVPTSGQYVLGVSAGSLGWQTPPEVVLADGAVTNTKIADGAITSSKIASGVSLVPDGSITNAKLAPNCVTSANIAPGTIVDTDVADNSVSDQKLTSTGANAGTYPLSAEINRIPRITITNKGRVTSASSVEILPFVRAVKFAESNTGEVGYRNGINSTIFLDSNGDLRVAGANNVGQFGTGVESYGSTGPGFMTIPWRSVDSTETISKFWLADCSLYVLSSAGRLYSTGGNTTGQLGRGIASGTHGYTLELISTLSNVVDFAVSYSTSANSSHCFAVTSSGQLWGWGNQAAGNLGRGTAGGTADVITPVQITANGVGSLFIKKAYAWGHGVNAFSYIVDTNDNVYSCGYNGWGALGLGDQTSRNVFTQVPTLKADSIFGCGAVDGTYGQQSVWIVRNGEVWATGLNVRGTLGYGDTLTKNGFVKLSISNVRSISCTNPYPDAGSSVCALLNDGTIRVWGMSANGSIGIPDPTGNAQLAIISLPALSGLSVVKTQFVGGWQQGANLFVLTSDGRLWVTGYQGRMFGRGIAFNINQFALQPVLGFESSNIHIAFDDFRVYGAGGADAPVILAKTTKGELYSWGRNANWQTGTPQATSLNMPQQVYI